MPCSLHDLNVSECTFMDVANLQMPTRFQASSLPDHCIKRLL